MPLSTNWRNTGGDVYISQKDGLSSNAGTQALPKQNLSDFSLYDQNVLRSGYYAEGDIAISHNNFINTIFFIDGLVVVDASSFSGLFQNGSSDVRRRFIFENDGGFLLIQNVLNTTNTFDIKDNCMLVNVTGLAIQNDKATTSSRGVQVVDSNILLNSRLAVGASESAVFRYTFIRSSLTIQLGVATQEGTADVISVYFDGTSAVIAAQDGCVVFNNCAFDPSATINGDTASTVLGTLEGVKATGTFTAGGFDLLFVNCFWTSTPLFNSVDNLDLSLQNTPVQSPLFNGNNIIGALGLGFYLTGLDAPFDPINSGVVLTNVTVDPVTGAFDLVGGQTEFRVKSSDDPLNCITLPEVTTFDLPMIFSLVGFSFFNGEWIDQANYDPVTNQEVRLTFLVSIYDESEPNGADNPLNWSPFYSMEVNNRIELDQALRGNGNVDADMTNLNAAVGKRLQIDFKFRTDGV